VNCIEADNKINNKVKIPFEWEIIKQNTNSTIARAKTYGGWVINSLTESPSKEVSESMVFIPDSNHQWEV
jgi:hypothetical protein